MIVGLVIGYALLRGVVQAFTRDNDEDPVAVIKRAAARYGMVAREITAEEFRARLVETARRSGG